LAGCQSLHHCPLFSLKVATNGSEFSSRPSFVEVSLKTWSVRITQNEQIEINPIEAVVFQLDSEKWIVAIFVFPNTKIDQTAFRSGKEINPGIAVWPQPASWIDTESRQQPNRDKGSIETPLGVIGKVVDRADRDWDAGIADDLVDRDLQGVGCELLRPVNVSFAISFLHRGPGSCPSNSCSPDLVTEKNDLSCSA
jgi:hypothetical protein